MGQANTLVVSHLEYLHLGKTDEERQVAYRLLFKHRIAESSLEEIQRGNE